jgi:hypothetical protein
MSDETPPEHEDDYKDVIVSTDEKEIREVRPPNDQIIKYHLYEKEKSAQS